VTTILALVLLTALAVPALAQDDMAEMDEMVEKGYAASFLRDYEGACKKLLDLAEATPSDKFGWRPTDEVRSISEVYIHTAGANFFFAQMLGVPMPEDWSRDAEKKVVAKADVIAALSKSIDHVKKALEAKKGSDLDAEMEFFGRKRVLRDVFLLIAGHSHEHLGQSIAYARMAGVVPPWSAGGG
jgi:uncharacterized damage-inducible protein DinB